jgi:Tfp pilus assembly protein PilN
MVKINLIKYSKGKITGQVSESESIEDFEGSEAKLAIMAAIKLGIACLGVIGLYFWDNEIRIPEKKTMFEAKQKELTEAQTKNNAATSITQLTKKHEETEKVLLENIHTIEALRGEAQREIRVLDTIQREMPQRMWLSKVEVNTEGKLDVEGLSNSEVELNQLIDILGRNTIVKEVSLISSKEKTIEGYNLKEFKLAILFQKYEEQKPDSKAISPAKAPGSIDKPKPQDLPAPGGAG